MNMIEWKCRWENCIFLSSIVIIKYVLDRFGLKVYDWIGVGIEWNYIYVFVV